MSKEIRKLTFHFENYDITEISLGTSLDFTYKELFKNASQAAKRKPDNISHGIKIIVFGSFWIEAYSNEIMRLILVAEIDSKKTREVIWNQMKKISIIEKFDMFSKISPQNFKTKYSDLIKPLKELFDLRNRLAHFKNELELIDPSIIVNNSSFQVDKITDLESFKNMLAQALPVPEINRFLIWSYSQKLITNVLSTVKLLGATKKHFEKIYQKKMDQFASNKH